MQGSSRYLQAVAAANAIATGSVHPCAGLTSFLSHCRKTSSFNSDISLTPVFQLIHRIGVIIPGKENKIPQKKPQNIEYLEKTFSFNVRFFMF